MKKQKTTTLDLAWTHWNQKDLTTQKNFVLDKKKESYKKILSIEPKKRTFENTVLAFEILSAEVSETAQKIGFFSYVSPNKKLREHSQAMEKEIDSEMITIEYNPEILTALYDVKKNSKNLDLIQKRLLKDYIDGYKRMGFDLPKKEQAKLVAINKEIAKLESDFQYNINQYQDFLFVSQQELGGLPHDFAERLTLDKEKKKYKIEIDSPESGVYSQMATSRTKRKELADKYSKKGGSKNLTILEKILKLRTQRAHMLGYKTHADFATEFRMAKNGKNVEQFLSSLVVPISKAAKAELQDLRKFAQGLDGAKKKLEGFEISYYSYHKKQKDYNLNIEEIKKYFPTEHVIQEMLGIYEELFSVKFEKTSIDLWEKNLQLLKVTTKDGKTEAHIALDLFPREGKYSHAAKFSLVPGYLGADGKTYNRPFCALVTNFPKPTVKKPSVIGIGDIETLFHEFGHALHHSLSKATFVSHSGTSVAWDFVEMPSQMIENWVWDPKLMKRLSKHVETGKQLDNETIDRIIKGRHFMESYAVARQLCFGVFDMHVHTRKAGKPAEVYQTIIKKIVGFEKNKKSLFPAGFGHICGGYDAGYYGYLWSLVYADDLFSVFENNGVMSKKYGMLYRKEILERGSERDEMDSIKAFLGRAPNNKAFLKKFRA